MRRAEQHILSWTGDDEVHLGVGNRRLQLLQRQRPQLEVMIGQAAPQMGHGGSPFGERLLLAAGCEHAHGDRISRPGAQRRDQQQQQDNKATQGQIFFLRE